MGFYVNAALDDINKIDVKAANARIVDDENNLLIQGLEGISAFFKKEAYRIRGVLLAGTIKQFGDFHSLLKTLQSKKVPMVWYDTKESDFSNYHIYSNLAHFHYSDSLFSNAPLRHLYNQGHRTIGFATTDSSQWQLDRLKRLQDEARAINKDKEIEIIPTEANKLSLCQLTIEVLAQQLKSMHQNGSRMVKKSIQLIKNTIEAHDEFQNKTLDPYINLAAFIKNWPDQSDSPLKGLWNFHIIVGHLLNEKITAIIAPSDSHCLPFLHGIRQANIQVPQEISLISYDNMMDASMLPVDTVDLGGTQLGYQAFHWINSWRKSPLGKQREFQGTPLLLGRGTVAVLTKKKN